VKRSREVKPEIALLVVLALVALLIVLLVRPRETHVWPSDASAWFRSSNGVHLDQPPR
jgi:hypothetical protein